MFLRIMFFLIGFGLMVASLTNALLFLNLVVIGYTFKEYVNFIIRDPLTYCGLIGFIIVNLTIYVKGGNSNELHL